MLNKVMLIGRLGADPEVRYTPDGAMITTFRLATDEQWKDKSGERVQRTEWHRIVTFGRLAEICGNYLNKGKLVSWRDGSRRVRGRTGWAETVQAEIVAASMQMLDGRGQGKPATGDEPSSGAPDGGYPEDDVPF
jgi:single-strand DNA-binding protein